ncbi:glycosyltransferase [Rhodobacteraceae bacterium]|nr:glycosyltransferase [Paracoccaceae bacterium]
MGKLAFIIHSLGRGGAERTVVSLAECFSSSREVCIYTNTDVRHDRFAVDKKILRKTYGTIRAGKFKNLLQTFIDFRRIIVNHNTLVVFMPSTAMKLIIAKLSLDLFSSNCKTQIIITERADPNTNLESKLSKVLRSFLYKFSDIVVCQTEGAKLALDPRGRLNVKVIGNGAKEPDKQIRRIESAKRTPVKIAFVGRLTDLKNPLLLPEICEKLGQLGIEEPVTIAGGGKLKHKLIEKFKSQNIVNYVHLGEIDNVDDLFADLGVLVFISKSEGFPNVILEALSWGWEVVSFDIKFGPAEIAQYDKRLHLVKYMDIDALVSKICNVNQKISQPSYNRRFHLHQSLTQTHVFKLWNDLIAGKTE